MPEGQPGECGQDTYIQNTHTDLVSGSRVQFHIGVLWVQELRKSFLEVGKQGTRQPSESLPFAQL